MEQKPQRRQRIVIKGEYARRQGQRGLVALCAFALWMATTASLYGIGVCAVAATRGCLRSEDTVIAFLLAFWGLFVVAGFLTYCLGLAAKRATQTLWALYPGIPLTRANIADLPASDSLIRASCAPQQEAQALLLRAATQEVETHEEQLVRAYMPFSPSRSGSSEQEVDNRRRQGI